MSLWGGKFKIRGRYGSVAIVIDCTRSYLTRVYDIQQYASSKTQDSLQNSLRKDRRETYSYVKQARSSLGCERKREVPSLLQFERRLPSHVTSSNSPVAAFHFAASTLSSPPPHDHRITGIPPLLPLIPLQPVPVHHHYIQDLQKNKSLLHR